MNLGFDISISMILFGSSILIMLIPFFGVSETTSISVQDQNYTVEFIEEPTLPEGDYTGSHDIVSGKITIATGGKGVLPFMTTCSHEVRHLRFDLEDIDREDKLSTDEEHKKMSGLGSNFLPWNWQKECFGLLDERFSPAL